MMYDYPTDHQIIRSLSRNTPNQNTTNHHHSSSVSSTLNPAPKPPSQTPISNPNPTQTHPMINNLRSTTSKLFRAITPNSLYQLTTPPQSPSQTLSQPQSHPIYQLNSADLGSKKQARQTSRTHHKILNPLQLKKPHGIHRSNSVSGSFLNHNRNFSLSASDFHHPPIAASSSDSINTNQSSATNQLRSKLERKLTQISHRLNPVSPSSKVKSQFNLNQAFSCSKNQNNNNNNKSISININSNINNNNNNNNNSIHPPKSKSSSSSSLSSLFDQSGVRGTHDPSRSESDSFSSSLKTPPTPTSGLHPGETHAHTVEDHQSGQSTCGSYSDHTLRDVPMMRNKRAQNGSTQTIYLPIEHDRTSLVCAHHAPSSALMMISTKSDRRQSPTQIALSRLDEILRGHHRGASTPAIEPHLYGRAPPVGDPLSPPAAPHEEPGDDDVHLVPAPLASTLKPPPRPLASPAPGWALSPPQRPARRKNLGPSSTRAIHRPCKSLHDPDPLASPAPHRVFIDPETWKSISISASKLTHHRRLSLSPLD